MREKADRVFRLIFWFLLGATVGFAIASFYIPKVALAEFFEKFSDAKVVAIVHDWLGSKVVVWVGRI